MRSFLLVTSILLLAVLNTPAQAKRTVARKTTAKSQAAATSTPRPITPVDRGTVSGHTYTNKTFGFGITFPEAWFIPDEEYEKNNGVYLGLKPPVGSDEKSQKLVDTALSRVTLMLSVYKYLPEMEDNTVLRVAVEDLNTQSQIKDAVDYIDAVRQMYANSKLPSEVQYSETQAEKLGSHQFAYIDLNTPDGKTRMYVTVRNRFAILFKISYSDERDLQTFRAVLATGNFSLK